MIYGWRVCLSCLVGETLKDNATNTRRKKMQRNYTGTEAGAREFRGKLVGI